MFDRPFDRARRKDSNTPGIAKFCRVIVEIAGVNGCELLVAERLLSGEDTSSVTSLSYKVMVMIYIILAELKA